MEARSQFSERELQIIPLLLEGKSNKQIALALGVSVRTVEFHLSNIYSKLGVSSRIEAALRLRESGLRESADGQLWYSPVAEISESGDNAGISSSNRRHPMKTISYVTAGLMATALVILLLVSNTPSGSIAVATSPNPTSIATARVAHSTETPPPAPAAKDHILEQIRQLVANYDQAVQAEKQNGEVEFNRDPNSGADLFMFKGQSYIRIMLLNEELWQNVNQLNALYVQFYRDELQPTPFPTQSSPEEGDIHYAQLLVSADTACADVGRLQNGKQPSILIYDIDAGDYKAVGIGDEYARCELYGQMIEEWRTAPMLVKVNKQADIAVIRQATGQPSMALTFQAIRPEANAPGRSTAVYADDAGTQYSIDVDSGRLVAIKAHLPGHPNIPSDEARSVDDLRRLAHQFAAASSPRLLESESVLDYEEGSKGDGGSGIYFFTWRYTSKDWSGTDWAMMPPFLQIGMLANGQIITYIDTLDLLN